MWLSVPYSECPTPYSSMFCSRCSTWNSIYIRIWEDLYGAEKILLRLEHIQFKANVIICALLRMPYSVYSSMFCSGCPTWNSIYIRSWSDLYGVEKISLQLEYIEFKANVVIRALLRMPYSVQQYVLLRMLYLEQYLYTKLGTSTRGRDFRLGNSAIRSRTCGYTELSEVRHSYPECPTTNIGTIRTTAFYPGWNSLMRRPDEIGRNEKARNFCVSYSSSRAFYRPELNPVKLALPTETQKSHCCVRPWSLLTILNFSKRGSTDTMV